MSENNTFEPKSVVPAEATDMSFEDRVRAEFPDASGIVTSSGRVLFLRWDSTENQEQSNPNSSSLDNEPDPAA